MLRVRMILFSLLMISPMALATDILTPVDWNNTYGHWAIIGAFDNQPTWNGTAPTGGDSGYTNCVASWEYANGVGYIDLGTNWADWRIEQTWTKYVQWRSGSGAGYAELWWDDDNDAINDGVTETMLNFNTQAHDSSGSWIRDVDCSSNPVIPQGRYLMMKLGTRANDPSEYAFVGYIQSNDAPVVDAGDDDSIRISQSASLDGTVTDDGLPDPPASVSVTWTKQSGPGSVTFGNASAVDTTASFSEEGIYVLRLTADDGELTAYDEVSITVTPATGILTPIDWNNVSGHWALVNAFNSQPTWGGSAPTGGDTGYNNCCATWETVGGIGYIDLGTNWADWRIEQTWTKYVQWRSGSGAGYAELWWDDDNDAINDGFSETTLNFNTNAHTTSGSWIIDVDTTSSPITPKGRYLMLKLGTPGNEPNEYAFVGYIQEGTNTAPNVYAGADKSLNLPSTAELCGAVSDDGRPSSPGTVTLEWTKQSGPGSVTFGNGDKASTSAIFSAAGTYVLRLTADDGELTAYDELTVTVSATGAPKVAMKDFMGINIHVGAVVQGGEPNIPNLYAPVTSRVRDYHPMSWDLDNTDDDTHFPYDKWNWINWSTQYAAWQAQGHRVNACIQFGSLGDGLWTDAEADAYAYGAAFATAFGPTYGSGVVASVQIGNEPVNMSDQLYITVFENMAKGIRDADPALTIVTCNVMNTESSGDYWKKVSLFEGLEDLVDAFAIHTYPMLEYWPTWERSYPEDPQMTYLTDVQNLIDWQNANAPDSELWITEFGYDSSSTNWSGNVTRTHQAQWLMRSFLIWSSMDMDRAYMYYYDDDGTTAFHSCSGLTENFEPKPAYHAQAHMQDMLGDYKFSQVIQKTVGDLYVFEYVNESDPDDLVWVAWSPTDSDRTTTAVLTGMPGTVQWAQRMPLTSGSAPSVSYTNLGSGSISISVTESPVYIQMVAN